MDASTTKALVLNAPEFFRDAEFIKWLNNTGPKFTWHQGGQPTEWSDTIVLVDPGLNGEGSDSDMPEHIWDAILNCCRQNFPPNTSGSHIMVWIKNLQG
jgi:hypothetical protein